ncbi:hypothetical protein L1D46_07830 [Pseudoalteromonas sp. Isolate3]|uniref:DUF6575 domain-containing protein n=1 Tax=Pseudoalteromonas sp. Isolate3 TaxID=2908526 RepID=UPI001EFEC877|nr:DUF6575 domain-containing protein [Pseudoalteromonas sp. Isolate3]MCG9708714.1 hypothetical protein [Pseudoalteromonas sp. Isolate3]
MHYLPNNETFGEIEVVNVYSHYDVPRTFICATENLGFVFSFWIDETETHDSWYYVCISEEQISRLESGLIQLRDLFIGNQIFQVDTPYDHTQIASVSQIEEGMLDQEALPPVGFALKKIGYNQYCVDKFPEESFFYNQNSHQVRISKPRSKKPIVWDAIPAVFGVWKKIHNEILESIDDLAGNIFITPGPAQIGSYKINFESSHNEIALNAAKNLFAGLKEANGQLENLLELGVDLSLVEELLNSLSEHNLQFEIRGPSGNIVETINYRDLSASMETIFEYNQEKLPSSLVPQANDVERIITYIYNKSHGIPFTAESEGIDQRQINYYMSASKMMGFVNHGLLTPIGWKLSEATLEEEQYKILKDRFETSRCGWAWMKFCNVNSALELGPETAEDFLRERSTGLSESTLVRRASTLRKWPEVFRNKLQSN